jgi:hypothetical protein
MHLIKKKLHSQRDSEGKEKLKSMGKKFAVQLTAII